MRRWPERAEEAALRIILGGIALLLSAGRDGGGRSVARLFFLIVVMEAALEDRKFGKAPDGYMYLAFALGLAEALPQAPESFFFGLAGSLVLAFPFFLSTLLRPGAFGGADIKLAAACGFYLGPSLSFSCLSWTFLFAAAGSLWRLLAHKAARSARFPFLPYLAAGIVFALLLS